jgi:glyoxylase-like metal-dependent hydrolase (beta-lactamase superfamily II)
VLYETGSHAVFFDPLAPAADAAFWAWADERCRGRAVVLLETIHFHSRSRAEFAARYDVDAATAAPAAVVAHPIPGAQEVVYWLPEHRALIPGDTLIVSDGALSICPASWLDYLEAKPARSEVARALTAALGELDVELVLTSHGGPVTTDARDALARALAQA